MIIINKNGVEYTLNAREEEEHLANIDKLKAEKQNNLYKYKRAAEYPSIGDQLDALFHAGVFPEAMAAEIQAIKNKYPKS